MCFASSGTRFLNMDGKQLSRKTGKILVVEIWQYPA